MANFDKSNDIITKEARYVDMVLEDGILYMYYKPLELLELDIAKAIVEDRLEFVKGISYPSLFDVTKVKQTTKEGRDYMANEGNSFVTASAILINSPMLKMAANFYIMVNKPQNPSRMFTDKKSAVEWLKTFKS